MNLYRITIKYEPDNTIEEEHFVDDNDQLALMNTVKFVKYRMKANENQEGRPLVLIYVLIRRVLYQRIDHSGYIPSFIKPFMWKWTGKGIDDYKKSAQLEVEQLKKGI